MSPSHPALPPPLDSYVSDSANHAVRRINITSGAVTTVWGGPGFAATLASRGVGDVFDQPSCRAAARVTVTLAEAAGGARPEVYWPGALRATSGGALVLLEHGIGQLRLLDPDTHVARVLANVVRCARRTRGWCRCAVRSLQPRLPAIAGLPLHQCFNRASGQALVLQAGVPSWCPAAPHPAHSTPTQPKLTPPQAPVHPSHPILVSTLPPAHPTHLPQPPPPGPKVFRVGPRLGVARRRHRRRGGAEGRRVLVQGGGLHR